jgi:hypothetical protein
LKDFGVLDFLGTKSEAYMIDCYSFGNGIIGVILMGSMETMESMERQ